MKALLLIFVWISRTEKRSKSSKKPKEIFTDKKDYKFEVFSFFKHILANDTLHCFWLKLHFSTDAI